MLDNISIEEPMPRPELSIPALLLERVLNLTLTHWANQYEAKMGFQPDYRTEFPLISLATLQYVHAESSVEKSCMLLNLQIKPGNPAPLDVVTLGLELNVRCLENLSALPPL